ncbi:family 78 glycoside hydrolase catalytic domain [Termitidicoccus mucosus]|uniref:alpha-L-rhamnosidase n=1 Tax=Termitidicoccus mucosus TaxID=1184151 RepID=A0A178IKL6_9BACT|nr:hypothetical protein AW736_08125 [Opitutaceae bacterium TSB47]
MTARTALLIAFAFASLQTSAVSADAPSLSSPTATGSQVRPFRQAALDVLQITPVTPARVEQRNGVVFADFDKAAFANLQIEFAVAPPDGEFTVRLGEKLGDNGAIDRKPPGSVNYREATLRTRPDTRSYTVAVPQKPFHLRENPVKLPESFGYITPFRYVEISGDSSALAPGKITLRQDFVHMPFDDNASAFESPDEVLNAVWDLCKYTMKATTAFGLYIDGERERIPYEGDAYINMLSHYACDLDPRATRATVEHLLEHPTWPTEWSLQMPMIAYADYEATGDPVLAVTHFDALLKKTLMDKTRADGLLRATAIVDWPPGERDGFNSVDAEGVKVDKKITSVANAFYYESLRSMERLARATGREGEAKQLGARADQVRRVFNDLFFDKKRGVYIDSQGSAHASLHANMFPLALGLVPEERLASVVSFVKSRGMACSVYGSQYLLEALYKNNEADAGLALMTAKTKRSWWHMIKLGSTMTLEAWDVEFKKNLTWNHAWGGAPANIITRYVLGVRPLQPGGARLLIAPQPASLQWMRGKVPTPQGPAEVSWKTDGNRATLIVTVPQGVTARVELPAPADSVAVIQLNGAPFTAKVENKKPVAEHIAAGRHEFSITLAATK